VRHKIEAHQKNRLIDVIAALEFSEEARKILVRLGENKLRVMVNPALANLSEATMNRLRNLIGVGDSVIVEDPSTFVWDMRAPELEIFGEPNDQHIRDGLLGWAVGSMTSSNTMTAANNGMIVANAAGQQSRVDAAKVAIARAKDRGHDLTGATMYTDSFMPFRDAVDGIVDAGFGAIIGTIGSVNSEALEAIEESGIAFIALPDALARGFRH
jgi:phosphoribosylaminoimidazolecarboxamide formyltransferase/IMP cyclohydrolase